MRCVSAMSPGTARAGVRRRRARHTALEAEDFRCAACLLSASLNFLRPSLTVMHAPGQLSAVHPGVLQYVTATRSHSCQRRLHGHARVFCHLHSGAAVGCA